jgi:hypothetical protein
MQARTTGVTGDPYLAGFAADTQNNATTPDNSWKIGTAAYNGSTLFTRRNGVQVDSIARTLNTANNPFKVGESTSSEFMDGDIAIIAAGQVAYSLPLIKRLEHAVAMSYKIPCS